MSKVSEIVGSAYRKAGITDINDNPDAAEGAEGLVEYNRLMFGLKAQGADTSHTEQALSDTFPLDAEYEEGIVYLLARRLEPNFQMPPSFDADHFLRTIQAGFMVIADSSFEMALTDMPSRHLPGSVVAGEE